MQSFCQLPENQDEEEQVFVIDFADCLLRELELEKNIDNIELCVQNLTKIFTEDIIELSKSNGWEMNKYIEKILDSKKNITLKKNQNHLLLNGILDQLMSLFEFIISINYKSLLLLKKVYEPPETILNLPRTLSKIKEFNQSKLPQSFFKEHLNNLTGSILSLFYFCSHRNSMTSSFFFKHFDQFYNLLYLFKKDSKSLLVEISRNSILGDKSTEDIISTFLNNLELPSFKMKHMEQKSTDLKILKNILHNLTKDRTQGTELILNQIITLFKQKYEKYIYIVFKTDDNNSNICEINIIKNVYTDDNKFILNNIRENIKTTFKNNFNVDGLSLEHYDQYNIELDGLTKSQIFFQYLKYYLKTKTLLQKSQFFIGAQNYDLNYLETKLTDLTLPSNIMFSNLNNQLKEGAAFYMINTYLFFDKYRFFTDSHDFNSFCQKM